PLASRRAASRAAASDILGYVPSPATTSFPPWRERYCQDLAMPFAPTRRRKCRPSAPSEMSRSVWPFAGFALRQRVSFRLIALSLGGRLGDTWFCLYADTRGYRWTR